MIGDGTTPLGIILLGPEWPTRALLRAQLLEEGYDIVATDAWPIPRQYRQPGMKPRVVIVDLHGLTEPHGVLAELRALIEPDRVLVVTTLGTLTGEEVRRLGFHAVARPARVRDIVVAAAALLRATTRESPDATISDP